MNNIKFVPNIRFRKFEKRWKTEKLEELGNTFPSLSGKSKKDFGHGNAKYITYMNVFTNPIASMSGTEAIEIDKKQNSVKYGDVLFTMSSETPEEVGMSSVWEYHAKNVYLNSFSFGFRPNSEFDLNFLAFLLRSQGVRRQIVILAQGISRFNISKVKMMGINVTFPTNFFEQQKIGDFFSKLDKLLDLQQQKIDKLELLKKALLQKLFPKHDAKIPELRFKGYEENWNEKRLNSITKRLDNYRKPITANKRLSGQTPYYGANGIQDYVKGYTHEGEFVLIAEDGANDVRNYPVRFVKGYIWVNNHTHVLQAKVGTSNNLFLSYSLKNKNLLPYLVGSGRMKLNADVLMNLLLKIPDLNEQQKIGNLLSKVDQLIELENKKLQNLQQVKKCLLQNMFVD